MSLITWDDSLKVGLTEIDTQHKVLVDLLNQLFDAMQAGKSKEVVGKVIIDLTNYTIIHFSNEERYFKQFGYVDIEDHILAHKSFVNKIKSFRDEFQAGNTAVSTDMMRYLKEWIIKHINGTDTKYVEFFKSLGIK